MHTPYLLALAVSAGSVFSAPHTALLHRDTASSIQAIETALNGLISNIVLGKFQDNTGTISSDYSALQSQLVGLSDSLGISSCGQGTPQPPVTADDAISALQQTQLGLNVVSQDAINSDPELQSAFCSTVGLFSAVGCFVGVDSPIIGVIGGCPAGNGSSGSGTSTPPPSATGCQAQYDSCRSVTDVNNPPNYSFCASQYSQCQSDCQTIFDQCATAPNANHAYCTSQEAACLGNNPFASSSSSTSEGESATTPAPTSSVSTTSAASPSSTAGSCQDSYNKCVTGSDPNYSFCASQFAGCKATCTSAWESCVTAPNSNKAYCSATYSACLGYFPFTTTSTPSATVSESTASGTSSPSPTSSSCVDKRNACVTAPDANFSYCASEYAGCQANCTSAWEACSTAASANHAFCASQYSACLGYYAFNTTSTTAAPTSSLSFGCNPAHSYPIAVTCILVNGTYEFSTFATASTTAA